MKLRDFIDEVLKIKRVFFVERRLPYTWAAKYHEVLYQDALQKTLRKAADLPPMPCAENGKAEIHTVTCKRDIYMSIFSLKSFLRYYSDVSIVVHGDESFGEAEASLIQHHIPGCKIWTLEQANETLKSDEWIFDRRAQLIRRFTLDDEFEGQRRAWGLKMFDYLFLTDAKKIMSLDSDTAFLQRPDRLIDWIESDGTGSFFSVPSAPNLKIDRTIFKRLFPNTTIFDGFNAGFLGLNRETLTRELIVKVVDTVLDHEEIKIYGDECIWRIALGHLESDEFPFENYPLIEDGKQFNEVWAQNKDKICYIHFLLKHRSGAYNKVAKNILKDFA